MAVNKVFVGGVPIGGGEKVTVQSMTDTKTRDTVATLAQIQRLHKAGCDIVRVAVENMDDARAISKLSAESPMPVVADIHFDARLAVAALENGAHKLRVNPGNIGGEDKVAYLADALKSRPVPVRIGVNSGSIEKAILAEFGGPTPQAMVKSALSHAHMLERRGFSDIVLSMKGTSVIDTITAYRLARRQCPYPLHVGFTHMGLPEDGALPSAIGIGALLADGIGDTIRVSLTTDPVREVELALDILKALGLRRSGVRIISCPTCGRCSLDVEQIATKIRQMTADIAESVTVAVMGCVVNGPGEARQADIGIAGGKSGCAIFTGGNVITVSHESALDALLSGIVEIASRKSKVISA